MKKSSATKANKSVNKPYTRPLPKASQSTKKILKLKNQTLGNTREQTWALDHSLQDVLTQLSSASDQPNRAIVKNIRIQRDLFASSPQKKVPISQKDFDSALEGLSNL